MTGFELLFCPLKSITLYPWGRQPGRSGHVGRYARLSVETVAPASSPPHVSRVPDSQAMPNAETTMSRHMETGNDRRSALSSTGHNSADLEGRVAIVTGGSRGIGKAIALRLGALGAFVVVNHSGTDAERPRAVVAEIERAGGAAREYACDVGNESAVGEMITAIVDDLGHIDILVANAGVDARAPLLEVSYNAWRDLFRVNVDGSFLCTREAARSMVRSGYGRVILIGSVNGRLGWKARSAYSATKGAIEAFARSAAWDLGPHGVTVNVVVPGAVETDIWGDQLSAQTRHAMAARVPVGRLGTAGDVAGVVAFLASSESAFITGSTIYVDGGRGNTDFVPLAQIER